MKREIHYHYYPGCCEVALIIETESHEEWQPMKIYHVATLSHPINCKCGIWDKENKAKLTEQEVQSIEKNAYQNLNDWVRWTFNMNHEKGISQKWIDDRTQEVMSKVANPYKFI